MVIIREGLFNSLYFIAVIEWQNINGITQPIQTLKIENIEYWICYFYKRKTAKQNLNLGLISNLNSLFDNDDENHSINLIDLTV